MTNEKTSIREKVHNAVAKCRLKIKRLLLPWYRTDFPASMEKYADILKANSLTVSWYWSGENNTYTIYLKRDNEEIIGSSDKNYKKALEEAMRKAWISK
jgi:hypothetical protein